MSRPVVWTAGHGTDSFFAFDRRIDPLGIVTIVDVRSHPYSRHAPDFAKATLETHAAEAGIGYRWLGRGLGGRPDDPALLQPDGSPDYSAISGDAGFLAALDELIGIARAARTVILCAELTPDDCHRARLIAPALEVRGFDVIHVLGDGSTRPHQPPLPFV